MNTSHVKTGIRLEDVAQLTAEIFFAQVLEAVEQKGNAYVALCGGRLQPLVYQELLGRYADELAWEKVYWFWSDERMVPYESPQSNFFQAYEHLLRHLNLEDTHVYPVDVAEIDPVAAAFSYQNIIVEEVPDTIFDVVMLGVGEDGHTASLFPGDQTSLRSDQLVVGITSAPKPPPERVTFTPKLITQARTIIVSAAGESKASVIREHFEQPGNAPRVPIDAIQPSTTGDIYWVLDEGAMSELAARPL